MNIKQALAHLGFMDTGEDPAPDCSTYTVMVATWRHPSKTAPTEAELQAAWDVILALPDEADPDADLQADIEAATNFAELKAALLGQGANTAAVKGRTPSL